MSLVEHSQVVRQTPHAASELLHALGGASHKVIGTCNMIGSASTPLSLPLHTCTVKLPNDLELCACHNFTLAGTSAQRGCCCPFTLHMPTNHLAHVTQTSQVQERVQNVAAAVRSNPTLAELLHGAVEGGKTVAYDCR